MNMNSLDKAILDCLGEHYGISGSLQRLPGENINYKVTTPGGECYVAKIVDEYMPSEMADLECQLMAHIQKAGFPLKLPQIIKNIKQKNETRIKYPINGSLRLRLIEFIEGTIWEYCNDISDDMLENAGILLGELDQALIDFDHPAAHRDHRWNLATAGQHLDKVELVEDPEEREMVQWAFDLWLDASQHLPGLPHQVIHADANRSNILIEDGMITGLVDFGDVVYNPRICELATCLAYLMMDNEDPLAVAGVVTAGYMDAVELTKPELDVLFSLICGRLAVTVCMATARKALDPKNPNWFVSLEPSLSLLRKLQIYSLTE